MLVVTHNLALAQRASDHLIMLFRGKVVWSGPTPDAFETDDAFVRDRD
jgi:ABC-type transporter Mla maintaining outer membrane lipid asymmetry ATPase subunit MlaF